ncbi:DUF721 domain-containing protein [Myceligenerans sp. TRM 65318]|uniref:DUF721 domain-containing protein n=1 Tax=Myceligenerans pegani TaxID=2776917 RepID=A0ABR9N2Q3_9MICO|nr:DUF721 domain-containing protein [Myceligenerans sp. TRM 65318]MBE3019777.1 DUF721 domain-containing protein [Myceligenerans sp. TRM 65318]
MSREPTTGSGGARREGSPGPESYPQSAVDNSGETGDLASSGEVPTTPPEEVARAALNRAKAAARAKGLRPGSPARRSPLAEPRKEAQGPNARDPQLLGAVVGRLLREKGWTQDVSVGGVVGRWRDVVGDDVAEHCTPVTFEERVLVVRADSTAWATQMRMLVPDLLRRMAEEIGEGVVEEVSVLGPAGPGFRRGPRAVRGPGPRDTFG